MPLIGLPVRMKASISLAAPADKAIVRPYYNENTFSGDVNAAPSSFAAKAPPPFITTATGPSGRPLFSSTRGGKIMKETLKNIVYAGLGAAFLTKDKIEELKDDLLEKGRLSQEEGKQFVDELVNRSEKAKEQLNHWVEKKMAERIDHLNLATKDEIAALRAAIDELRQDIAGRQGH
jgi:polyhydroxyalkanoate synthesis regulator phasin